MLKLTPLASGSKGNASLLSWKDSHMLIDCGINNKALTAALEKVNLSPSDLEGIVVTHEHADHIGGVRTVCKKHGIPAYLSEGTLKHFDASGLDVVTFDIHEAFEVNDLTLSPFPIPHDARETCAFTFHLNEAPEKRMGYLTDCGHVTPYIVERLKGCSSLALEANHCPDMLREGPYPPSLKLRVGGGYGHLSNGQAADLLERLKDDLSEVCLMHLSEKNNSEAKALEICRSALPEHIKLRAATQNEPAEALVLE